MPQSAPDAPVRAGHVIAGRYRLGPEIGRGGRAVVHAAEDLLLGRQVALKVFVDDASLSADLRLQEAEARLLANLNHYALTTLFDAGVEQAEGGPPRIHLVMERVAGLDLKQQLALRGPLSPAQVAVLGFDLAEGLQHVHEHGFLHRDLKPANVLIAHRGLETRIRGKLADFGIATLIGLPELGGEITGTAAYVAPEQVEGEPASTASDVYALGLVLLEALTGEVAFPGSIDESLVARLDGDPPVPARVPSALAGALRAMTARRPERRPGLDEVALAFQRALVQDLVDAGRVQPERLARHEEGRLAAVRRYDVLDTEPDAPFDRVVHLACRLLDVPVALLAIVDAQRVWIKASRGTGLREVERDGAICARATTTGRPFAVADVRADDEFAGNALLRSDPSLRGFASVPLRTDDGHAVGTLCVFSREVREFGPDEIGDLAELAAVAVRELDLRRASRRAALGV